MGKQHSKVRNAGPCADESKDNRSTHRYAGPASSGIASIGASVIPPERFCLHNLCCHNARCLPDTMPLFCQTSIVKITRACRQPLHLDHHRPSSRAEPGRFCLVVARLDADSPASSMPENKQSSSSTPEVSQVSFSRQWCQHSACHMTIGSSASVKNRGQCIKWSNAIKLCRASKHPFR